MWIVTGALGFIGSSLVTRWNLQGRSVLAVDDCPTGNAWKNSWNFGNTQIASFRENTRLLMPEEIISLAGVLPADIEGIVHLGAISDKAEMDAAKLFLYNTQCTTWWWNFAKDLGVPFLYASSGATYGMGEQGFSDSLLETLRPNDPYGQSKLAFDRWAMTQKTSPENFWGVRFFNVFGPNEYHKGFMASPVFHGFHQIRDKGNMRLFRSGKKDVKDGEQKRDFIYIEDALNMVDFLINQKAGSGIYNIGTGRAQTYLELASALFKALNVPREIEWVETPATIQEGYQYFTQADITKIQKAGFKAEIGSLETRVAQYAAHLQAGAGKPGSYFRG